MVIKTTKKNLISIDKKSAPFFVQITFTFNKFFSQGHQLSPMSIYERNADESRRICVSLMPVRFSDKRVSMIIWQQKRS